MKSYTEERNFEEALDFEKRIVTSHIVVVMLGPRLRATEEAVEARQLWRLFQASHGYLTDLRMDEQWVGVETSVRSTNWRHRAARHPNHDTQLPIP